MSGPSQDAIPGLNDANTCLSASFGTDLLNGLLLLTDPAMLCIDLSPLKARRPDYIAPFRIPRHNGADCAAAIVAEMDSAGYMSESRETVRLEP